MSGRKLGGGRILGSGKGLAPPAPPASTAAAILRSQSPFAPSETTSTPSLGSQNSAETPPISSSPLADFAQDLTSNISLGGPSNGGTPAEAKLVCPICGDEMLTLLQLNRHLDDAHQELPEVQQDEVKTWFDKQVLKAKKFQPLSLINQKLLGLEVFESNESTSTLAHHSVASASSGQKAPEAPPIDPDDLITKSHWQRPGPNDACTDPACGKRLGGLNGTVNCRSCGLLFCDEHTLYQMRLAPRTAAHDPVRGLWYRVCETCYKSREGYNDHTGSSRDHAADFMKMRRVRVERQNLEIQRLEKRLTKLTRLLADPSEEALAAAAAVVAANSRGGSLLSPVASIATGQQNQRKALEQMVVTWEEDVAVAKCPFCQQEFGSWTFRRHHCRTCGRVVCADPQTGCSSELGLTISSSEYSPTLLEPVWFSIVS